MSAHPFQNVLNETDQIFTNRYLRNWQRLTASQNFTYLCHFAILHHAPQTNWKPCKPGEDFDDNALVERQRGEDKGVLDEPENE